MFLDCQYETEQLKQQICIEPCYAKNGRVMDLSTSVGEIDILKFVHHILIKAIYLYGQNRRLLMKL